MFYEKKVVYLQLMRSLYARYNRIRYVVFLLLWPLVTCAVGPTAGFDSLRHLSTTDLMEQGRSYYIQRQPAQALACFTIISERSPKTDADSKLQVRALNNCGCVYKYYYFDYTQAYDYFIRAYDLCEELRDDEFLPVIMVNLGDLLNDYSLNYNSQPLAQQAQELFDKSIHQAAETKNWELLTTAFFNLANQNYDLKLDNYRVLLSKEIPDSTPDLAYTRLLYQAIGHMQRQEYVKARDCFSRQLQVVSTQWAPERDSLASYMNIAATYRLQNNYQSAVDYLLKALQLTADNDISDLSAHICQQLSEQYRLLGDETEAARYHLRYMEMMEKTHLNQLSHIAELNYIRELKKEEAKTQQLEERQRLQQLFLLAAFIVLVVILFFTLLLWYKNRQLKERNKSLYEKNRQVMRIEADEQNLRKAYSKSSLNDEQRESLILRIQEVLNDPDVICQQDFTLSKLAKLINSNTTYVSQVINEKYGMAFSSLLGSCRIKIACQWMEDPARYGNITIEAIATGTGFKSRTAFVNVFKRETGLKPSEYLRMATAKMA